MNQSQRRCRPIKGPTNREQTMGVRGIRVLTAAFACPSTIYTRNGRGAEPISSTPPGSKPVSEATALPIFILCPCGQRYRIDRLLIGPGHCSVIVTNSGAC